MNTMNLIHVFILSIVEGITEFLPISSTGRMIVVSKFLHMPQTNNLKAFEVIIQLSAIFAIVLYYKTKLNLQNKSLWFKIVVAFLPIGMFGFLFSSFVKSLFSVYIVAFMFIVGGVAFIFLEHFFSNLEHGVSNLNEISYTQAFKVGLWQILALIPGTSRSGATIFGGMISGLSRQTATEFSFLLALPVMISASGYDLFKNAHIFTSQDWLLLIFSSIVSFIAAYATVKLFLAYIKKHNFISFGIYRIVFGLLLFLFYL